MPFSDKKSPKSLDLQGFQGFSASDFNKLKVALGATTNYYMQSEKIFRYSKLAVSNLAYISDGSVYITATDLSGFRPLALTIQFMQRATAVLSFSMSEN